MIIITLFVYVFGPWLTVNSINTIFGTNIEFTVDVWLSFVWLYVLIDCLSYHYPNRG